MSQPHTEVGQHQDWTRGSCLSSARVFFDLAYLDAEELGF